MPGKFFRWRADTGARTRYLLTADPVETRPGRVWVVQGALDRSRTHAILGDYWETLSAMLAGAVLCASGAGFWVARRGLAPVHAISAEIGRVNSEKLHLSIGDRPWPSGLQGPANSFDAMLARLDSSFEQLSRFSSDLAHELRSPLNNLAVAASVTLTRERSNEEYKDTLAVSVDEGERLSRTVSSCCLSRAPTPHSRPCNAPRCPRATNSTGWLNSSTPWPRSTRWRFHAPATPACMPIRCCRAARCRT